MALSHERGTALVGVLLLLMIMSALAAALGVSGQTETLVVRNHQTAAQARAAAEAGLNHGIEAIIDYISTIDSDAVAGALDSLLGGNVSPLGAYELALGVPIELLGGGDSAITYELYLMDEDDTDRGDDATNLQSDGNASNDEDDDPLDDNNLTIVLRAVGRARNNAAVTLEAMLGPVKLPAIATDGDLVINGNPDVLGSSGGVHANGDLSLSGNPSVATDATASGAYTSTGSPNVGGLAAGGQTEKNVSAVLAMDYLSKADYILNDDGAMTLPDGTVICNASADNNACKDLGYAWVYQGANGWLINNEGPPATNVPLAGTYYVEGDARISGSPGSTATPVTISIIAEGSIDISGSPVLTPDTSGLMFVTDGDLEISGNLEMDSDAQGQMLVHEQLRISGNPDLFGQIIVEDAANTQTLVDESRISGNPSITYNGGLGSNVFALAGWREVR